MLIRKPSYLALVSFPLALFSIGSAAAQSAPPASVTISSGWQLQDVAKVKESAEKIAAAGFKPKGWYAATVPGTVLTTLVNNKVYPDPAYGENNRPEIIPESLNKTSYWYRTAIDIPAAYAGPPRLAQLRRHQLLL